MQNSRYVLQNQIVAKLKSIHLPFHFTFLLLLGIPSILFPWPFSSMDKFIEALGNLSFYVAFMVIIWQKYMNDAPTEFEFVDGGLNITKGANKIFVASESIVALSISKLNAPVIHLKDRKIRMASIGQAVSVEALEFCEEFFKKFPHAEDRNALKKMRKLEAPIKRLDSLNLSLDWKHVLKIVLTVNVLGMLFTCAFIPLYIGLVAHKMPHFQHEGWSCLIGVAWSSTLFAFFSTFALFMAGPELTQRLKIPQKVRDLISLGLQKKNIGAFYTVAFLLLLTAANIVMLRGVKGQIEAKAAHREVANAVVTAPATTVRK